MSTSRPAWGIREVADAAFLIVPDAKQSHHQYERLFAEKEAIICGAMAELCRLQPSYHEMATLIGCTASTATKRLEMWRAMYWRDRMGWLQLIEGRLNREASPVDAAIL